MVKVLNIKYTPSHSVIAQGKNVNLCAKNGYYRGTGGNGSYRMNKPSKAILKFEVNGEEHSCSVKQLIRDTYSIYRVGKNNATKFLEDVQAGNIQLEYSDEKGLYVKN
jgi:hypothetical protein